MSRMADLWRRAMRWRGLGAALLLAALYGSAAAAIVLLGASLS